ncbi:MAG: branched-chain amino acid aminotransferase [Candidatus Eremiobacteraeota bacterium]|nr:branched-chain amino acid aminotransferase [Candidatus Eremiobacteraeota bacterium]MEA2719216.1 branched-chain amino acid aminotransferase [Candidatus Eremiobacteraeota bacterium]
MMTRTATTVWLDGSLLDDEQLRLHALTHALHYGSSVFEGIRVYPTPNGPAVFRLREHVDRLIAGAAAYGMDLAWDADGLIDAIRTTVRASGRDAAYVRPLAFFGGETVRLNPGRECPVHMLIAVLPFDGIMPGVEVPLFRASVSPFMKTPSRALPSTVKAGGHYTNSIRALADAQRRGFDETILRNEHGDVAEGSGENIFIVRDGALVTNDADADILLGVTRASVLALAREAGITTHVRPITMDDLAHSDEAFFTGTAAEVVPIVQIDDRDLGGEGPLTRRLRTVYTDVVRGRRPAPGPWLTQVS